MFEAQLIESWGFNLTVVRTMNHLLGTKDVSDDVAVTFLPSPHVPPLIISGNDLFLHLSSDYFIAQKLLKFCNLLNLVITPPT